MRDATWAFTIHTYDLRATTFAFAPVRYIDGTRAEILEGECVKSCPEGHLRYLLTVGMYVAERL